MTGTISSLRSVFYSAYRVAPRLLPPSLLLFRQHNRADHGDQQQDGGHLERQEILIEEDHSHLAEVIHAVDCRFGTRDRACRHAAEGQQVDRFRDQDERQPARQGSLPRDGFARRKLVRAQQHDDEQEQHHDGARVNGDLRHGDERRAEEQIEHRHRREIQHQEQRRVDRVAAQRHAQRGRDGDEGEDEKEN